MKKALKAEWIPEIKLYRIFDPEFPHQTIAYFDRTEIEQNKRRCIEEKGMILDVEGVTD